MTFNPYNLTTRSMQLAAAGLFSLEELILMISAQIERLRKDSRELSNYVRKLEKKGRNDLAHKVSKKQAFIEQHIEDMLAEGEKRYMN